ncbi:MAG: ABC transporter ATP-binding protein [Clostridia bacterium]|nr:ABC transporter ATP-binding protein [Clostridia bacterium]
MALDNLSVGYHKKALIEDISFSLQPGEILTLIGPNGAGKSTILKSISKQLAAISGVVMIDGHDMQAMRSKDIARKMAVMLTNRTRPELMSCTELVSAGRYPYTGGFGLLTENDKRIVEQAIATVHAQSFADALVSEISDGQLQRILLARALCQEPEIIVLDEPTSYLDVKYKIELLEILRSMAKTKHITVVMSLHEIDLAEKVSDKIVCVKGDHIADYGAPHEIFTDEKISALYDLETGAFSALFGSVELAKPQGKARCFVIGGNGYGIPFYRVLQKEGIAFSAGILAENDVDYSVARALAQTVIAAAAFSVFGEEQIKAAKAQIDAVEVIVHAGCPVADINRANTLLLEYAQKSGKTILSNLEELTEMRL